MSRKKIIKGFFLFALLQIIGCAGGPHLPFGWGKKTSLISDERDFVEVKSGKVTYGEIKGIKKEGGINYFTLKSAEKFQQEDVIGYQQDKIYYRRIGDNKNFAKRMVKGKINVYRITSSGGPDAIGTGGSQNTVSASYYIQKGDNGIVYILGTDMLKDMVKDHAEVFAKASKLKTWVPNIYKYEKIIKEYNK